MSINSSLFKPKKIKVMTRVIPLFSLLIGFLSIFNSCKKSDLPSIEKTNSLNFSVEEAKTWYGKNIFLESSTSRNVKHFEVLWNTAQLSEDSKHLIMECHLKLDRAVGFSIKGSGEQTSKVGQVSGEVRILLLKNKADNEIHACLFNMYSNTNSSFDQINYHHIPEDFAGFIFFTNLQGQFFNGYEYLAGKIVRSTKSGKNFLPSKKPILTGSPTYVQPIDDCSWVTLDTYERDCLYNNGTLVECGDWQYMYSESIYVCPDDGGGGGGGAGDPIYYEASFSSYDSDEDFHESLIGDVKIDESTGIQTKQLGYNWGTRSFTVQNCPWCTSYKWGYRSFEIANLEKANYDAHWKYSSLVHSAILREGVTPSGYSVSETFGNAYPTYSTDMEAASMTVNFQVILQNLDPTSGVSRNWIVNKTSSVYRLSN